MRTTLTLNEDVAQLIRDGIKQFHRPLKEIINDALRLGLDEMRHKKVSRKPYHTKPHAMGLKPGYCLDNIQDLLSQIEGENAR